MLGLLVQKVCRTGYINNVVNRVCVLRERVRERERERRERERGERERERERERELRTLLLKD